MKTILVIGLGRFGKHMATRLVELGNEVLVIDNDEEKINQILPYVTNAQIGDSTNEMFISSLGVRNFDLCVVAIGDSFQSSLETTALLKDHGAKFIIARASRDVHAKFLTRIGADKVVYIEKDMGYRLAVKYSLDHIFDYVELNAEYSIYEIFVPPAWVGHTITQIQVRTKYRVSILAVKQDGHIMPLPKTDHVFTADETLIIMGKNEDVRKLID